MRRVAAAPELQYLARPRHLAPDRVELRHGAVLVVLALDREHRARDARQVLLDVPLLERRVEPGVVPEIERLARIGMVLGETLRQVRCFESAPDLADARQVEWFYEYMGSKG